MDEFLASIGRIAERFPELLVVIVPVAGLILAWKMEGKFSSKGKAVDQGCGLKEAVIRSVVREELREEIDPLKTSIAVLLDRSSRG